MVTDKIKELEAARAKLAELEAAVAAGRDSELASLPTQYGFSDAESFMTAVRAAAGSGPKRRGRKPKVAVAAKPKGRTRARITDETRAEVKKLAEVGKTGAEIAKATGISLPSVQKIKEALGLVKKKKK